MFGILWGFLEVCLSRNPFQLLLIYYLGTLWEAEIPNVACSLLAYSLGSSQEVVSSVGDASDSSEVSMMILLRGSILGWWCCCPLSFLMRWWRPLFLLGRWVVFHYFVFPPLYSINYTFWVLRDLTLYTELSLLNWKLNFFYSFNYLTLTIKIHCFWDCCFFHGLTKLDFRTIKPAV